MTAPSIPTCRIEARFYRAVLADRIGSVLDSPGPQGAGRYHRPDQPALYITPEADWAAIALGPYMAEDGLPRLIVPLDVEAAHIVNQRDPAACATLGIDPAAAGGRWRPALAEGREPSSWRISMPSVPPVPMGSSIPRAASAAGTSRCSAETHPAVPASGSPARQSPSIMRRPAPGGSARRD